MIYLASKTVEKINSMMAEDQGASFRTWLGQVVPHMGDAYRGADPVPFRTHMGASGLGNKCDRAIFYGFRWCTKPVFDGRMLRLFNRGHLEEARFIAMLLMIGVQIYQQDENGKQYRISDAGGHLGGSGDGIGVGLPDLEPGTPFVTEFKTASDKKFQEMVKSGVQIANFTYYVQMQLYMGKMGIGVALFMMVNKNNDEIHAELVPFNRAIYEMYLNRGVDLVFATTPPAKISESPGWYECKWCDHYKICHKDEAPYKTCRSCAYVKVESNGTWTCQLDESSTPRTPEEQYKGCEQYSRGF